jgi:hypothetical protein
VTEQEFKHKCFQQLVEDFEKAFAEYRKTKKIPELREKPFPYPGRPKKRKRFEHAEWLID